MAMIPIGARVEIAPHYDLWVKGMRYGTVEKYTKGRYQARNGTAVLTPIAWVRFDRKPDKLYPVFVTDLTEIE